MCKSRTRRYFRPLMYLGCPLALLFILIGQSSDSVDVNNAPILDATRLPEQQAAELPEFQAVTDRTTELGSEEMPAYWRLLGKVEQQSFEQLQEKGARHAEFDTLLQAPANCRGELFQMKLNVRRVLAYELDDSPLGAKQLYEIWGWQNNAPENLFVVLTDALPKGMSVGASVYERAEFCGFFFKLQGYLPAGAEARLSPLAAPLLVGRIVKCEPTKLAFAHNQDLWRIGLGAVLALSLIGSILSRPSYASSAQAVAHPCEAAETVAFEEWLDTEHSSPSIRG